MKTAYVMIAKVMKERVVVTTLIDHNNAEVDAADTTSTSLVTVAGGHK